MTRCSITTVPDLILKPLVRGVWDRHLVLASILVISRVLPAWLAPSLADSRLDPPMNCQLRSLGKPKTLQCSGYGRLTGGPSWAIRPFLVIDSPFCSLLPSFFARDHPARATFAPPSILSSQRHQSSYSIPYTHDRSHKLIVSRPSTLSIIYRDTRSIWSQSALEEFLPCDPAERL